MTHGWLPPRIVESAWTRLAVRGWAHLTPGVDPAALARVLDAMPVGLHPMEIQGFFSTPNPNLIIDDRIVSAHYLQRRVPSIWSGLENRVRAGRSQDVTLCIHDQP